MLDVAAPVFASFKAVKAASVQSGKDTIISAGADSLTLKNVSLSGLVAGDVTFH